MRVERGRQTSRRAHPLGQQVVVGGDAGHTVVGQGATAGRQVLDALEQRMPDDGFEGVELQLAGFGRHGNGHVVADDLKGDLVDYLGNDRVDLAGHDRRAGRSLGQLDLVEAGLWSAGQQAQIVADLGELDRDAFEYPRQLHERAGVLGGFDQVSGGHQPHAGQFGKQLACQLAVADVGVDAGADRGGAKVDFLNQFDRFA